MRDFGYRKKLVHTMLIAYNVALVLVVLSVVMIVQQAPLLIEANLSFLWLIGAAFFLQALLILIIVYVDYRSIKERRNYLLELWKVKPK